MASAEDRGLVLTDNNLEGGGAVPPGDSGAPDSTTAEAASMPLPAHPDTPLELASTTDDVQARLDCTLQLEAVMQTDASPRAALTADDGEARLKGTWRVASNRYRAYGWDNGGRQSHLGVYPSRLLAAKAADVYSLKYYGADIKRLNFPLELYSDVILAMDPLSVEDVVKELVVVAKRLKKGAHMRDEGGHAGLTSGSERRRAITDGASTPHSRPVAARAERSSASRAHSGPSPALLLTNGEAVQDEEAAAALLHAELTAVLQQEPTGELLSSKGISECDNGRWHAQLTVNKSCMYLGTYDSQELAAKALDVLRLKRDGRAVHFPVETYQKLLPALPTLSPAAVREQIVEVSKKLRTGTSRVKQARDASTSTPAAKKQKLALLEGAPQPDEGKRWAALTAASGDQVNIPVDAQPLTAAREPEAGPSDPAAVDRPLADTTAELQPQHPAASLVQQPPLQPEQGGKEQELQGQELQQQ